MTSPLYIAVSPKGKTDTIFCRMRRVEKKHLTGALTVERGWLCRRLLRPQDGARHTAYGRGSRRERNRSPNNLGLESTAGTGERKAAASAHNRLRRAKRQRQLARSLASPGTSCSFRLTRNTTEFELQPATVVQREPRVPTRGLPTRRLNSGDGTRGERSDVTRAALLSDDVGRDVAVTGGANRRRRRRLPRRKK